MDFNFNSDYILENERVLLRPLQLSDFQNLVNFSINEPELWQYSLQNAAGVDELMKYLQDAIKARSQQREYPFVVFDKIKQQYAGCTRFYDVQLVNKTMQLGYTWYGANFQGTGINKNCKYLMLEFAFEKAGMERIEFRADNNNERSIAAMKSIGCTVEGVLRSNLQRVDGTRRDSIVLSILRNEWFEKVKEMLMNKIQSSL
ncbi:GNAT family N-acetyltransferase [Aridibaculum aurantiacum]|uniref:GNAT family N-acetyltransferase n=1 Tax=Aridibaculum aurantiacum TaxID=2810307 RepID=UPI001A9749FC|nr:GNAT family protein [Aridibaculum aurantiacum]